MPAPDGYELQRAVDRAEGRVGVCAQRGDGREADHDDQCQHDGVLDSGGATFGLEETFQSLHSNLQKVVRPQTNRATGVNESARSAERETAFRAISACRAMA